MNAASLLSVWAVPIFIALVLIAGTARRVPVFDEFLAGAGDGISTCVKVLPSLVALMTAVSMLRASGLLEILVGAVAPAAKFIGIPPEIVPLALLRPVSGSGSLAMLENIYSVYGADSLIGRVASVLQSSTETTFYTMTVYYGSVGIKRTRHTLVSAASGDLTGILLSSLMVKFLVG
jgi:spore maturation protein B